MTSRDMAYDTLDDAVMVSLPWTPTMSEFEALKDAMPKMDAEFDNRKKVEQLEARLEKIELEYEERMEDLRQTFETKLQRASEFLVATVNRVNDLQHRLDKQDRQIDVLKQENDEMQTRMVSWEEWKEVSMEWTNSMMTLLFGESVMGNAPQTHAGQNWEDEGFA